MLAHPALQSVMNSARMVPRMGMLTEYLGRRMP
jgi:hypothetical protein